MIILDEGEEEENSQHENQTSVRPHMIAQATDLRREHDASANLKTHLVISLIGSTRAHLQPASFGDAR